MADADWHDDNAMSFFTLGTTLLRNRWRILAWGLISATMAGVISKATKSSATITMTGIASDSNSAGAKTTRRLPSPKP